VADDKIILDWILIQMISKVGFCWTDMKSDIFSVTSETERHVLFRSASTFKKLKEALKNVTNFV
jgi:hypothetical protein